MDISLSLEDHGGGKVTAHVAVVNDDGTKAKGAVAFLKGARGAGQARLDDDGFAERELTLKVGELITITASVVGKPQVRAQEDIIPEKAKKKASTGMEWVLSFLFIIVAMKFGYTTFIVVGLLATVMILTLSAAPGSQDFVVGPNSLTRRAWGKLRNNDIVFYTFVSLFLISFVCWLGTFRGQPITEFNPLEYAVDKLKDAVAPPPTDPWANEGFGSWLTNLLLGNNGSWFRATIFFLICLPFAWITSFLDNWLAVLKDIKPGGEKKGVLGGLTRWISGEVGFEIIKKVLGGGK